METSFATPTTLDSPEHVAIAEDLGYARAWFYDSPQQSPDVWMVLALAAQRTSRIGLGPGVLVPTLRHPMVNAAGTAALEAMAPGRVAVGFGTGFTGRLAMGVPRPIGWSYMEAYITAFKGLLRGETVEWEGGRMRMLHPPGHAADRPVDVPVIIGALGPKGEAVTERLGDGLFTVATVPWFADRFAWVAHLCSGTVLDEGEDPTSERVRATAGPGTLVTYHSGYESGADLGGLPGGPEWLSVVASTPVRDRHLAVHDQHLVGLNAADRAAWDAGAQTMVGRRSFTGTAAQLRARLDALAERGVTEIVYQPAGPDIRRELERFMRVAAA
jgi:5,10-methylenetetrahydromethanopterin reductase